MRTPKQLVDPNLKRTAIGAPRRSLNQDLSKRIVWYDDTVSLWAWPSRGGMIVLEKATALDFEFLGLDTVEVQSSRDENQDVEDELCQRLLLLGAKWFDSRNRYGFVAGLAKDEEPQILAVEDGSQPAPTTMERRWVSVAIPSSPQEGFWVAEYDTTMYGMQEKHNLVPTDAPHVSLAKTMDEKCEILKRLGAKFYANLDQYDGPSCLNAWKTKTTGEIGPLVLSND